MEKVRNIRVAAYCRVSTAEEIQVTSLAIQTEFFKHIITEHEGWDLVEVFSDRGLTGLNVNRPEFQRMMSMAREGKIDIIMVKSISRASRNTVDLLKTVRELKELGVYMYFCKENVNTQDSTSELLLTVFAAFSEEESRQISENTKRGARLRFSLGRPNAVRVYGFKRVSKGNWVVNEEEAEIIREAYRRVIEGESTTEICDDFNKRGLVTSDNGIWKSATLHKMLTSVRYKGDALMQKTYVKDFLTGVCVDNSDAKVPQYYKKGCYEAIVSEDTFDLAVKILKMKSQRNGMNQYPYYGILVCPFCGAPMVGVNSKQRKNQKIWFCGGSGDMLLQKERSQCPRFAVTEMYIDRLVTDAINELNPDANENAAYAQRIIKKRGKPVYGALVQVIQKITFIDRWTMEITWKDGNVSTEKIDRYESPLDVPMPEIRENGDEYECFGCPVRKMYVKIYARGFEKRKTLIENTQIKMDPKTGIPTVRTPESGKR